MKLNPMLKSSLALVAALAFMASVGCASSQQRTAKSEPRLSPAKVRVNPSPRLQSLTRSYEENFNLFARTQNNRMRAIHDDVQMILFLNRNTGLTEFDYPLR